GPGVVVRRTDAAHANEPVIRVNATTVSAQRDPDMVWTGSELVIAWVDASNARTAPDLRYRVFDRWLSPVSDEQTLGAESDSEAGVALAPVRGSRGPGRARARGRER